VVGFAVVRTRSRLRGPKGSGGSPTPPAALAPEAGTELLGLARSILTGAEQTFGAGRALAADPAIRRQRVRAGSIQLPGLVIPELVQLADEKLAGDSR